VDGGSEGGPGEIPGEVGCIKVVACWGVFLTVGGLYLAVSETHFGGQGMLQTGLDAVQVSPFERCAILRPIYAGLTLV